MKNTYDILILGASYGSLLATKLLFGGHRIKLVCLPAEAEAINKDGARVRLPVKGRSHPVELDSRTLPGQLSADGPSAVRPADYDLVDVAACAREHGFELAATVEMPANNLMVVFERVPRASKDSAAVDRR